MILSLAAIGVPFIPGWTELRPFIAELTLICTIVAVLLTPFFVKKSNTPCALVALAGLVIALVSLLLVGPNAGEHIEKFAPMLVADPIAFLWKVLLLLCVIGVILMWFATSASDLHEGDGPEFFVLLLGATTGMAFMSSANNLLMLLISVELASFPSYVLAGFRKTNKVGAEASLKYVLFGAATSAVMTYGMSLLYGLYGTLNLSELCRAMPATTGGTALLVVSIFALIVGIGFKIAAVPFHFWCPDVFEGASIEVTTFLSVASKGAALVLLLRICSNISDAYNYQGHHGDLLSAPAVLAIVLGILGALSATVGNTAAFAQTNIKRLLAYSSIAHAGYMLCAMSLLLRTNNDVDPTALPARTILFYLAVYLFMNLGAFTVAGLVLKQTGVETLDGYAGLSKRNPLLAFCMMLFMFSFVGLPPLAGFTAKFNILIALIQTGGWWWLLVAVIAVNTVLSLYFYMRVVRSMYLSEAKEPAFMGNPLGMAVSLMCAIMLIVMFIATGPLSQLTSNYGHMQFSTAPRAAANVAIAK
ncbi:NADH-quinone oxidoreductase subunit N [soil metagenome]